MGLVTVTVSDRVPAKLIGYEVPRSGLFIPCAASWACRSNKKRHEPAASETDRGLFRGSIALTALVAPPSCVLCWKLLECWHRKLLELSPTYPVGESENRGKVAVFAVISLLVIPEFTLHFTATAGIDRNLELEEVISSDTLRTYSSRSGRDG
jgi:hypothetical protein